MSDMTASLGLDDDSFKRGLSQVEQHSRGVAQRFERDWGQATGRISKMMMGGFGTQVGARMAGMARGLLEEYSQLNDTVGRAYATIGSGNALALPVMRGLGALVLSASGDFIELERTAGSALTAIQNGYADLMRFQATWDWEGSWGNAAAVDSALVEMERQTAKAGRSRAVEMAGLGMDSSMAAALGDQGGADEAAERLRHMQELTTLSASLGKLGAEGTDLLIQRENELHELRMRNIRQQAEARGRAVGDGAVAAYRESQALEQRATSAMRALDLESARMGIEVKRLQGLEHEAAIDQIRLDRAQRLQEIAENTALSEHQRAMWTGFTADRFDELEKATRDRAQRDAESADKGGVEPMMRTRVLGAGLGGELARQVFGPSGGVPSDAKAAIVKTARAADQIVAALRKVQERLDRGVIGVLA